MPANHGIFLVDNYLFGLHSYFARTFREFDQEGENT